MGSFVVLANDGNDPDSLVDSVHVSFNNFATGRQLILVSGFHRRRCWASRLSRYIIRMAQRAAFASDGHPGLESQEMVVAAIR
jgi:hypothetical protein